MLKQDKATTERYAKTLRELVKQPGNKVCADCKRNDPRWASWNLGIFLCIRCSGIHRSMGTHISRVKSIDLDVWTSEQLQSMVRWGNINANLYWEAHLKQGHVPPDHKVESFIRSKYESRRWALDIPLPADPSTLGSSSANSQPSSTTTPQTATIQGAPLHSASLSNSTTPAKGDKNSGSTSEPIASGTQSNELSGDLFSLDFTQPSAPQVAPASLTSQANKSDIMALFSSGNHNNTHAPFTTTSSSTQHGSSPWDPVSSQAGSTTLWAQEKKKDDVFGDIWSDFR